MSQGLLETEITQGVGLQAHLEPAVGLLRAEAHGKGEGRGSGGGATENITSGHAHQFGLLSTDRRTRSVRGSNLKDIRSIRKRQAIKQVVVAIPGFSAKDSVPAGRFCN